jgi:outer membrane protein OmpA-like peptidoglycan-associated protein
MSLNEYGNRLHHIAISVNGTFVKAYVDNKRVINDPDGITRPVTQVGLRLSIGDYAVTSNNLMFSNFRVAEGGKDIKSALKTDGRIVTHGILFDSGSDWIKPESTATLKGILEIMNSEPALKFSVEGHTDNQGGKTVNQPLSEKRAASVKAWLAGKGITPNRLQSKGWGASKPIDANDSAEGRANNRRVEFVKI